LTKQKKQGGLIPQNLSQGALEARNDYREFPDRFQSFLEHHPFWLRSGKQKRMLEDTNSRIRQRGFILDKTRRRKHNHN